MSNEPYYRPYVTSGGVLRIVCLQDFDEPDYDARGFFTEQRFATYDDAADWVEKELSRWERIRFAYQVGGGSEGLRGRARD